MIDEDHNSSAQNNSNDNKVSTHVSRKGTDVENRQGVGHVGTDWHSSSARKLHEIKKRNKKHFQSTKEKQGVGLSVQQFSNNYNLERHRPIHHGHQHAPP